MASQPSLLTSHQVPENLEGLPRLCPLRIRAGDAQSWVDLQAHCRPAHLGSA